MSAMHLEEVATMEIYTMTERPSVPLNPACAQAVWPVAILAAEQAPVSRVHQVQVQAELAQALTSADGINGTTGINSTNGFTSTTGFKGLDVSKRYADGGSGVPPRGRPV